MLTALIVEDEALMSGALKKLLADQYPDISVLNVLTTLAEANHYLKHVTPDILFLDVNLPDGLGIHLEALSNPVDFDVIFCTAHESYAIDAFRMKAADFLLKPVRSEDFKRVMSGIVPRRRELQQETTREKSGPNRRKKLMVHTQEGIEFLDLGDILYCKARQNYTEFFLQGGKYLLSSKTLKEFDEILSLRGFARIHQSYLVNLDHVTRYIKGKGGKVLMQDGSELEVSQNRKEYFLQTAKNSFLGK